MIIFGEGHSDQSAVVQFSGAAALLLEILRLKKSRIARISQGKCII